MEAKAVETSKGNLTVKKGLTMTTAQNTRKWPVGSLKYSLNVTMIRETQTI
ncbi:predicted protein [Botrytis cinerea T4]|uniref:Uncharacterized protein n=1 Tax=Botryotinia fuckeliana (strain T4) TaxID=999810 RepID=G2YYP4_BOTF4|nr:predicted protein [Botrytis cinerea T4]